MITTLRFILFFLLAPVFAIVGQAAGMVQDSFRIVDAGYRAESVILDSVDLGICNYDSSGALLQQRRSLDGKSVDEDDLSGSLRIGTSLAEWSLSSFSAELVATNRVPTPNGNFYSTAFETRLSPSSYPGVSRGRHFQEANENLLQAMDNNPSLANSMRDLGINLERTPTGLAPRTSPADWTWHHAPETGVMQLVPRSQHAPGSIFQDVLHPGGQGGFSIWGK